MEVLIQAWADKTKSRLVTRQNIYCSFKLWIKGIQILFKKNPLSVVTVLGCSYPFVGICHKNTHTHTHTTDSVNN